MHKVKCALQVAFIMFCSISKVEHMATVLHLPAILDGCCLPFFISNSKMILNSN